jgi:hypothetical protein
MKDIQEYILKKYFNPKEHRKIIEEAARRAAEDQKRLSQRYKQSFNK